MHSDPIADFIIRIKNGYMAKKQTVTVPASNVKKAIADILKKEGYIADVKRDGTVLTITLHYENGEGVMRNIVRVSKPGLRVYVNKKNVPRVLQGYGFAVVSTPHGLMTDKEARKKGVGGEVLLRAW